MADENENLNVDDASKATEQQQQETSNPPDPFAELDTETRDWLTKRELTDPKALAKNAFEQAKLLGNAIRVPGKNATEEERAAFLNKLGRPETPEGYEFAVPKDLPENLPYDGERAKSFAAFAHSQGLTKEQARAVHDWAAKNAVDDYTASSTRSNEEALANAKRETDKLVKRWGPLDSDTAKANLEFADRALTMVPGGAEVVEEFKRVGLIGRDEGLKIVQSEPIAVFLANIGSTLFKENDVLKGTADVLGNPFSDGDSFNLTTASRLIKDNEARARSLIAAAGKKPADFGLKP